MRKKTAGPCSPAQCLRIVGYEDIFECVVSCTRQSYFDILFIGIIGYFPQITSPSKMEERRKPLFGLTG